MPSSDILVLGGGANGLAAAFRLAKGGAKVTLVESRETVGGGATTAEFAPGFRTSGLAHLMHGLDARAETGMDLSRYGLRTSEPLPTTCLGPNPVTVSADGGETTGADRDAWRALARRLDRHAARLAPFRSTAPPRLKGGRDWRALAGVGFDLVRSGRADARDLLKLVLINAADVAEDELGDPLLQGLIAFDATLGAWAGPRSPGSLLLYLNRRAQGPVRVPVGGMGCLAGVMAAAAADAGVSIRTGARAVRLIVENDRARGAVLATGEELRADLVVSALCPRATLVDLAGARHLDTGTMRRAMAMPFRGAAAKLHIAVEGDPGLGADLAHRLVVAPSVDAVERAFNPVKYGETPKRPVLEIIVPTAFDPALAPDNHHVLSVVAQFAPHAPKDREAARSAFADSVLSAIEDHAPGFRGRVRHVECLMPYDIEARYGLRGGSWHHGDLAAERMLFLRPFPEAARYAAPIPGLWLASAGSHPGGGVTGTPGWNAAELILKEAA